MAASQTRTHRLIVLSYVFYLASHADALSFNYSSPDQPAALVSRYDAALAFNATTGISSVLVAGSLSCNLPWADADTHIPFQISEVYSSASLEKKYYVTIGHLPDLFALRQLENRSCTGLPFLFANALQRCACAPFQVTQAREAWLGLSCSAGSLGGPELRSLPGYTSTRGIGTVPRGQTYTAFWFCSHMLRDETTPQRLLSSTDDPNTTTRRRQIASSSWMEQASVAGSAFGLICAVAGVAGLVLCCIRSKRPRQRIAAIELEDGEHIIGEPQLRQGLGPREFCYSDLAAATEDFAEGRKIGRGGFGPVYRGCLIDQDLQVAIKKLSRDEQSVQGLKEFQAEVTVMSQLRHRNIVRLVGWCGRRGGLALVYELMSGGSLDAHLYNPDRHLTWPQRYKIALQLGSALRYLHTDCDQCVVHGDIKPANIMLDACGNAKLGDFGLARLVDHGAEPQTTQVVAGTVGYIDPEFVSSRRRSAESDVYSYGVVLLEIACGRRPTPSRRARASGGQAASAALLLACVRDMYRRNVILEAADRRLDGEFDEVEMERLLVTGLWCAQQDPVQRPSIAQAMDVLRLRSEGVKLPVLLGTMVGPGEIRALEGQAYGDLPAESSAYLDDESTETAYLTTEETTYLFPKE